MRIKVDPKLKKPMRAVEAFLHRSPGMDRLLADTEITIGLASNPEFQTPAGAIREAVYVGDAAAVLPRERGGLIASKEVEEAYSKNPDSVDTRFIYDARLDRYRMVAQKRRFVVDGVALDAAPDLMGMQALSPWNVGWFQEIFKAPLLYSHAEEVVEVQSGTEPWCEVMNMNLTDYAGFAQLEDSGAPSSNAVADVNVQAGLMSSPVINMTCSYSLAVEEIKRAEQSSSPFGSQLVTIKQKYADYVLAMLTSYLIYFGNTNTETVGLLGVPPSITAWGGTSLNGIYLGASATKGSDMYGNMISVIVPFLDTLYNKVEDLDIIMSPIAYNRLTSSPYSSVYNPESALRAMLDNFMAGKGEKGTVPNINIIIEPLFMPSTVFNANTYDYFMLVARNLRTGPENAKQPMVLFGAPLMKFVYPTIPGSYNTQYKFLRRVAGVFCPVQACVAAWSGFGIKTPAT